MEYNEVKYYIVDKNRRFISCDYEAWMLYSSDYINGESWSSEEKIRAKDAIFNLEQDYLNGEYGKMNVEFPLRVVKVATSHIVEEVE